MKTLLAKISAKAAVGIGVMAIVGCAEPRPVVYQTAPPPPVYAPQPVYQYPPQTAYAPPPAGTPAPAPVATPSTPAPLVAENTTPPETMAQPPPSAPVEVIPASPAPGYYWTSGYWVWRGGWVWQPGVWVVRPHPAAIWVGPRWAHHGRRWVWVRGYWRY